MIISEWQSRIYDSKLFYIFQESGGYGKHDLGDVHIKGDSKFSGFSGDD